MLSNSLKASRKVTQNTLLKSLKAYSTTPIHSNQLSSFFSNFSIKSQQNRIQYGEQLFRAAQHQAFQSQWFDGPNGLPSSFRPTHALLSLHVWFLHRRLIANPNPEWKEQNLKVQEELFDIFWNDTQARIRAVGVNELTVNKHLKDAQRATFVHITQYDEAFEKYAHDAEKRFELICDAVWRNILMDGMKDEKEMDEDDVDDEMIRRIGAYVEYQYMNIVHQLPEEYFRQGKIAWGNLPDFTFESEHSIQNGDEEGEDIRGMTFLEGNWVQVLTDAGNPYYWNTETNETSWTAP